MVENVNGDRIIVTECKAATLKTKEADKTKHEQKHSPSSTAAVKFPLSKAQIYQLLQWPQSNSGSDGGVCAYCVLLSDVRQIFRGDHCSWVAKLSLKPNANILNFNGCHLLTFCTSLCCTNTSVAAV